MHDSEIFSQAIQTEDLEARNRFLQEACGADTQQRQRIEALIDAHEQPDSLLDAPHSDLPTGDQPTG
ncbi:MAG: hypothetical protein AAGF97_20250, partial [Planctomycetota bacterium]